MKLKQVKKNMEFGDDWHANIYKHIATIPTWLFLMTGISGNTVTIISFLFLLAGGYFYFQGQVILAFLGMFIYTVLDYTDGRIAKIKKQKSLRGYFLDGMCHQFVIPLITIGLAYFYYNLTSDITWIYLGISGAIFAMMCEATRYRRRICILEKTNLKGKEVGVMKKESTIKKLVSFVFNAPVEFSIYIPIILFAFSHMEYTLWLYGIIMPVRWLLIFYTDSKFDESLMIRK